MNTPILPTPSPLFLLQTFSKIDDEKIRAVREAIRNPTEQGTQIPTSWILAMGALLVLAFVGNWAWNRYRRIAQDRAPLRTFEAMAGDLGLGWPDRKFLISVAQQQRLPSPLTLMLSGDTLAYHAAAYAGAQPSISRGLILSRAESIRLRLFGQPATPTSLTTPPSHATPAATSPAISTSELTAPSPDPQPPAER